MATLSRSAEGMRRLIDGEVNLADFPPLSGDSRGSPRASSSHGGSRASPDITVHGPFSPLHGGPRVSPGVTVPGYSSVLHGDARASPALSYGGARVLATAGSSATGTSAMLDSSHHDDPCVSTSDAAHASVPGRASSGVASWSSLFLPKSSFNSLLQL